MDNHLDGGPAAAGYGSPAVLVGLALGVLRPTSALATTITVNTTADQSASATECHGGPSDCSLRRAIDKAGPGDTVSLPASATPYAITLGQLELTKALAISGAGARTTQIRGNGSSRIFDASSLHTLLATGSTSFGGGAAIIDQASGAPAALILDPAQHSIALAPEADGTAATGVLRAGGQEIVSGPLTIATRGVTDPVAGLTGLGSVSGIQSIPLSLSAWNFLNASASVYIVPGSDSGGGALVDGRLALTILGAGSFSGQLAVQVTLGGAVDVISGAVALPDLAIPGTDWGLTGVHVGYKQAGDVWSGGAGFTAPGFGGLSVNPLVIKGGKLDDLEIHYHAIPPIVIVPPPIDLAFDSADLGVLNLANLSYSQPAGAPATRLASVPTCILSRNCTKVPPPPPPPEVVGGVVLSALGETLIGKANFTYLIDGGFTATGTVSMEPPFSDTFPDVTQLTSALPSNQTHRSSAARISAASRRWSRTRRPRRREASASAPHSASGA
jgi:hypothetical protein